MWISFIGGGESIRKRIGKNGINNYEIIDDYVVFHTTNLKGENFEIKFSLCDLEFLLSLDGKIYARITRGYYYPSISKYMGTDKNGKSINKNLRLHKMVLGVDNLGSSIHIDHKNHDTLDCRRENMRVVSHPNNSANRKGANKNNNTGARNVSYIKNDNTYRVQIMKNGIRYKWTFPADKFDEACKFAEEKRKEIFGEFAGEG